MASAPDLFDGTYAVVVGGDLNGLGVIRSLAEGNVPVLAVESELHHAALSSRFCLTHKIAALSGPVLLDELLTLRTRFDQKPVLFLTQEASVATVSAAYERLSAAYHLSLPAQSVLDMLLDKQLFQAEAERLGFPVPRSMLLDAKTDPACEIKLRFPCVLKPTTKDPEYGKHFAKAYRVSTPSEVDLLWREMRSVIDDAILQEWIEGGDDDVYFCLQYRAAKSQSRTSFVGRKLLQWPPLVGGTASCIPAPDAADELTELTDMFFEKVGFVGIGSMEYKRDRRDGKYYMVEPTAGRTDYQEEVATLNGVNIPLAAYCAELGQNAPSPKRISPPRAWRDPVASYRAARAGAIDPLARSQQGLKVYDAYFRLNDPGPYIYTKFEALTRRLARFGVMKVRE